MQSIGGGGGYMRAAAAAAAADIYIKNTPPKSSAFHQFHSLTPTNSTFISIASTGTQPFMASPPVNGHGEFTFSSGGKYSGEWLSSTPHGRGTMEGNFAECLRAITKLIECLRVITNFQV
jgi:hypothetical protein